MPVFTLLIVVLLITLVGVLAVGVSFVVPAKTIQNQISGLDLDKLSKLAEKLKIIKSGLNIESYVDKLNQLDNFCQESTQCTDIPFAGRRCVTIPNPCNI